MVSIHQNDGPICQFVFICDCSHTLSYENVLGGGLKLVENHTCSSDSRQF